MSADKIQVNYELLDEIASQFDHRQSVMADMLARLQRQLENLRDGFEGEAADHFFNEMDTRVLPRVNRLHDALGDAAQTTRHVYQTMAAAEDQAANLMRGDHGLSLPQNALAVGVAGFMIGGPLGALAGLGLAALLNGGTAGGLIALGDGYSWREFVSNVAGLEPVEKNIEKLASSGMFKAADWLAAQGSTDLKSFYTVLERASPALKFGSKAIEFGVVGGAINFALAKDHSLTEFGAQMGSSVTLGVIGKIPYIGPVVVIANGAVQLGGNLTAEAIKHSAAYLTGSDLGKAQQLVNTANRFEEGLKGVSLDERFAGVYRSVLQGDNIGDALSREAHTFVDGVGTSVHEGGEMISEATAYPLHEAGQFVDHVVKDVSHSSFVAGAEHVLSAISPW